MAAFDEIESFCTIIGTRTYNIKAESSLAREREQSQGSMASKALQTTLNASEIVVVDEFLVTLANTLGNKWKNRNTVSKRSPVGPGGRGKKESI